MEHVRFAGPPEIQANLSGLASLGTTGAQATRFRADPSDFQVFESPNLFVALINKPRRASYRVAGKSYERSDFAAGDMIVVPQRADWIVDFETAAESLCVFLPETTLMEALGDVPDCRAGYFEPLSEAAFRAPLAEDLIRGLCAEAATGGANGPDYADALTAMLAEELAERARPGAATTGMAIREAEMTGITSFILAKLEEKVTVTELADKLGMPKAEFSKAFRLASGLTPYQYIMKCRVDFARDLILTSNASLTEIAYRAGFSSQSHMTDTFRNRTGLTPAKLRDSRQDWSS